ncbi:hypothetical protein OAA60_01910 [Porticoccaceae bacterium]|jgi:hypothetical protein|nr:hypothetical protein [Porticoccaceae bacterium]
MPTGKNWSLFILVNALFVAYVSVVYYTAAASDIKENWNSYRCNPMYMPMSDDIESDFSYCVQNIQSGIMGHMLQPLTFITSSLTNVMSSTMGEINSVRKMFNKIRTFISNIVQSIFAVFLNMIIEFIRIIIGMRDLFGKTIGTMTSLMYIMEGGILTMKSAWNGPSGQLVRALGKCFHPETKIRLLDGTIKQMQHAELGDVLENGSTIESVMRIHNKKNPEFLYELFGCGINDETLLVTGSHSVWCKLKKKFIYVRDYHKAKKTDILLDWFSCLITDDHKIGIGNELYWDWEDQLLPHVTL